MRWDDECSMSMPGYLDPRRSFFYPARYFIFLFTPASAMSQTRKLCDARRKSLFPLFPSISFTPFCILLLLSSPGDSFPYRFSNLHLFSSFRNWRRWNYCNLHVRRSFIYIYNAIAGILPPLESTMENGTWIPSRGREMCCEDGGWRKGRTFRGVLCERAGRGGGETPRASEQDKTRKWVRDLDWQNGVYRIVV